MTKDFFDRTKKFPRILFFESSTPNKTIRYHSKTSSSFHKSRRERSPSSFVSFPFFKRPNLPICIRGKILMGDTPEVVPPRELGEEISLEDDTEEHTLPMCPYGAKCYRKNL